MERGKVENSRVRQKYDMSRNRERASKNDPIAQERKLMAKKETELNKTIDELHVSVEKAKASEEKLTKENEMIKKNYQEKELEVEKLSQFWLLSQQQLQMLERKNVELEAKMQKIQSVHVETVSLLHKRISMLQLNTQLEKEMATQTDPFGQDSDCTGQISVSIQTESEWDRSSVNDLLKGHDEQLAELIAEIENTKIQAQADYKFAVVQMEQGLREEHEEELRAVKEEKERQLEEMVRIQNEQLLQYQETNAETKAHLNAEITQLKVENSQQHNDLVAKEEECTALNDKHHQLEQQYGDLQGKYKVLSHSYEKNKVDQGALKKDVKTIADLRNRMEKIEEINEILLGEFKKVEDEKNLLTRPNMRNRGGSTSSLQSMTKGEAYGELVDNIRREHGGLAIQ
ncbi:unnamed protein product [Bursaphelenchus xylophilus]|uniref:(pine wood nematode) hypothetical protein n=1 Tax=Bursaphelenchus xylophilus TaxID=6326 RepID=A0A1I7RSN4_BURXY|nr:unnamed protein product [Bursaphelenchus xylophilus]CAG9122859.1 unnamed protein product [Bursaphelenchus xylophilus]